MVFIIVKAAHFLLASGGQSLPKYSLNNYTNTIFMEDRSLKPWSQCGLGGRKDGLETRDIKEDK